LVGETGPVVLGQMLIGYEFGGHWSFLRQRCRHCPSRRVDRHQDPHKVFAVTPRDADSGPLAAGVAETGSLRAIGRLYYEWRSKETKPLSKTMA
jgi:hypothetical protein